MQNFESPTNTNPQEPNVSFTDYSADFMSSASESCNDAAKNIGYIVFKTQFGFPKSPNRDPEVQWRKMHGLTYEDVYKPVVDLN